MNNNKMREQEKKDATFVYELLGVIIGEIIILLVIVSALSNMNFNSEKTISIAENQQKMIYQKQ